jgi:hypothetical protein
MQELVQRARQALEEEKHYSQFKSTVLPTKINKQPVQPRGMPTLPQTR